MDQVWDELRVLVPLETRFVFEKYRQGYAHDTSFSNPHPFISILGPSKGKKILPRLTRHLNSQRMLTLLTLLVACFNQLDVVRIASLLDSLEDSPERADVERQTGAFLASVMQSILPIVAKSNLRLITGLLGLLLDRSNIAIIAQTKVSKLNYASEVALITVQPGLALLTLFLSRVEVIKQSIASGTQDIADVPTTEEAQQWYAAIGTAFKFLIDVEFLGVTCSTTSLICWLHTCWPCFLPPALPHLQPKANHRPYMIMLTNTSGNSSPHSHSMGTPNSTKFSWLHFGRKF